MVVDEEDAPECECSTGYKVGEPLTAGRAQPPGVILKKSTVVGTVV